MLVWIAILYLLIVGFGSFIEWAARSRVGIFVFFNVLGFVLGGVLIAVAIVFIQEMFDEVAYGEFRYHEFNGTLWFVLSLLTGLGSGLFHVFQLEGNGPPIKRHQDRAGTGHQKIKLNNSKGQRRSLKATN